jgi:hypothetical protein
VETGKDRPVATTFLHLANGTSTTSTIHDAGIPGRSSIWADPLHEGPVPAGISDEELLAIRARHLADEGHGVEAIASAMRRWRSVLDDVEEYDELVLWFEHDLFDQLNLIQVLDRLARQPWPTPVSLVTIGSFPGRPQFKGLGELTAGELGPLFETRQLVTAAQYALGARAWSAFRSPDPTAIEALLATDTTALPYLAAALQRHLEEFPSMADGLSRTERRILELASNAPIALRVAFPRMHDEETAFYIADVSYVHVVRDLAAADPPLIVVRKTADSDRTPLAGAIALTDSGMDVLVRRADRVELCGIERWLGGVHLSGRGPTWRWDHAHERLVRAGR